MQLDSFFLWCEGHKHSPTKKNYYTLRQCYEIVTKSIVEGARRLLKKVMVFYLFISQYVVRLQTIDVSLNS